MQWISYLSGKMYFRFDAHVRSPDVSLYGHFGFMSVRYLEGWKTLNARLKKKKK